MINAFTLWMMLPWAGMAALLIWVQWAQPDKQTLSKYPRWILFISIVPFYHAWETRVAQSDLRQFLRYRRRYIVFYFGVIAIFVLQMLLGTNVALMRRLFLYPGTRIMAK